MSWKICTGNFRWTRKATGKNAQMHRKKMTEYLRLFAEVPRLTMSIWRKIRRNLKQCSVTGFFTFGFIILSTFLINSHQLPFSLPPFLTRTPHWSAWSLTLGSVVQCGHFPHFCQNSSEESAPPHWQTQRIIPIKWNYFLNFISLILRGYEGSIMKKIQNNLVILLL